MCVCVCAQHTAVVTNRRDNFILLFFLQQKEFDLNRSEILEKQCVGFSGNCISIILCAGRFEVIVQEMSDKK